MNDHVTVIHILIMHTQAEAPSDIALILQPPAVILVQTLVQDQVLIQVQSSNSPGHQNETCIHTNTNTGWFITYLSFLRNIPQKQISLKFTDKLFQHLTEIS